MSHGVEARVLPPFGPDPDPIDVPPPAQPDQPGPGTPGVPDLPPLPVPDPSPL